MKLWYLYTRDIGSHALSFQKGGKVKKTLVNPKQKVGLVTKLAANIAGYFCAPLLKLLVVTSTAGVTGGEPRAVGGACAQM